MSFSDVFRKNKLEKEVYAKLSSPSVIAGLKADGLMFLHIYTDLTCLVKSRELSKSVKDMGMHYLGMDGFLEKIEENPCAVFDECVQVFGFEPALYDDGKLNHRRKPENIAIRIFTSVAKKFRCPFRNDNGKNFKGCEVNAGQIKKLCQGPIARR